MKALTKQQIKELVCKKFTNLSKDEILFLLELAYRDGVFCRDVNPERPLFEIIDKGEIFAKDIYEIKESLLEIKKIDEDEV